MTIEQLPGGKSLIDVLDRVLNKGIVIDAWVRLSLVGIDLTSLEAQAVVASTSSDLPYADDITRTDPPPTSPPDSFPGEPPAPAPVPAFPRPRDGSGGAAASL